MKILVKPLTENALSLLRRTGYIFQRQDGEEMSFIRPLSQSGYPRFHCYAKTAGMELRLSIHLDQKKHTYGETTRHHGEYENEGALRDEVARMLSIIGETGSIVG